MLAFAPKSPRPTARDARQPECAQNLKEAVLLLMEDRREDARRKVTRDVRILELA
jgi:hypothetical protein